MQQQRRRHKWLVWFCATNPRTSDTITSATTTTLPAGVRAKESNSALYHPHAMPSTKMNCRASSGKANSNRWRQPQRPTLPQAVHQQRQPQQPPDLPFLQHP